MKYSKISAFITAACLTVSLAPAQPLTTTDAVYYAWTEAEDSVNYDDIRYDLFSDHAVVKYCGEKKGDVVIPSEIEGLPVTKIFDGAFYSEDITSITLPDTIDELSSHMCTGCIALKSIRLPANIKSIPEFAFDGCKFLEEIEIPSGVTEIGRSAFDSCRSLKKADLPEKLEKLDMSAFSDCALETLNIPAGVKEIPSHCFAGNNFTEITIPENVETVDSWSFIECPNVRKFTVLNPYCNLESRLDFIINGDVRDENGEPVNLEAFDCTCYGYMGSTLEKLAKSAKYNFVALDEEKELRLGDPTGDGFIDAVDASNILAAYAKFSTNAGTPSADDYATSDVNKDGFIDAVDASTVLAYYAYLSADGTDSFEQFMAPAVTTTTTTTAVTTTTTTAATTAKSTTSTKTAVSTTAKTVPGTGTTTTRTAQTTTTTMPLIELPKIEI